MNYIERMEMDRKLARVDLLAEENARLEQDVADYSAENARQRELLEEARALLTKSSACPSRECSECIRKARSFIAKLAPLLPEVKE